MTDDIEHTLKGIEISAQFFKCIGAIEAGFGAVRPINVIIGRNNAGKSALVDLIDVCVSKGGTYDPAKHNNQGKAFSVKIAQTLDAESLQSVFRPNTTGGGLGRDHWSYGQLFVGERFVRAFGPDWKPTVVECPQFDAIQSDHQSSFVDGLGNNARWLLDGVQLRKVTAERDVNPEGLSANEAARKIKAAGNGTTNVIASFYTAADLPRQEVVRGLLEDLNEIYRGDSHFDELLCRQDTESGNWEVHLHEAGKGDIRLSQSGSSLKTVLIIASILRLSTKIEKIDWGRMVFAIEEPENNLHPALLRRLMDFLAAQRTEKKFTLIITTHSPICIDWASKRADSQIIHVQHDGNSATTRLVTAYEEHRGVLDDLDIRASDLLQANGIIWVEGPTERVYLNKWIELVSNGNLKEGSDYSIMFYGGKLLSHLSAWSPDQEDALISLLRINRNVAVMIDSDRKPNKKMVLNSTKMRVRKEVEGLSGFAWVTQGREIENYVPKRVWEIVTGSKAPAVDWTFEKIPDQPIVSALKKTKVELAHAAIENIALGDIDGHLDLRKQLDTLCEHINRWNRIK